MMIHQVIYLPAEHRNPNQDNREILDPVSA